MYVHKQNSDGPETMLDRIVKRVPMRSPRALSQTIMEMVAEGDLVAGTRLPTVRELADALGMSPAGVATAWRELVDWRVLETRRRGGTTVLGPAVAPRAARYDVMMKAARGIPLNLGHLTPDRSILPPLDRALAAVARSRDLNEEDPSPISAALGAAVAPLWPFPPAMLMATNGGVAALELVLSTSVRPGDRVIVESPTLPRALDILEEIGARAVPVTSRPGGPDLDELQKALKMRPAALLYQPLGAYPTGHSISADWIARAASLLGDLRIPIIELVLTPFMHPRPWPSLGTRLPQTVVHAQGYNFFFGADLRVGVVGGSDYYIDRMWQKVTFSSGWVSRILQDALAFQLTDPGVRQDLEGFIDTCRRRQRRMVGALREVGFDLPEAEGPAIWLPVADEYVATQQMSSRGVVVHPGRYFSPVPPAQDHVLVNGMVLADGHAEIAAQLAVAAALPARGRESPGRM